MKRLTESAICAGAMPMSFQRGQQYYRDGAVLNTAVQGRTLSGDCEGSSAPYYQVRVELDEAGVRSAQCTCPYDHGGWCKHIVALLLTYAHEPERFVERRELAELLAGLGQPELVALISRLVHERPELYDWLAAAVAVPVERGQTRVAGNRKVDVEVYRRQVRQIMHGRGGGRPSEAYWRISGVTRKLDQVRDTALQFLDAGEAKEATEILLALVEGVGRDIDSIGDEDGYLSRFVNGLGPLLAEAILSQDLDAAERARLADHLTDLAGELADYGMDEGLDLAIQAATRGWDEGAGGAEEAEDWGEAGEESCLFGDLTDARLNVLARQGHSEEYLALCREAGRHLRYALKLCDLGRVPEAAAYAQEHLATASEALEMAQRLRELGRVGEAVALGERGLALAGVKARLGEWLGPIEEVQGRTDQALAAWLAVMEERPSLDTYKAAKRLAGPAWGALQPQVLAGMRQAHNTTALAEVLLFEQEWDEAIRLTEGGQARYGAVEIVAGAVVEHRPEWVARTSIRCAERLMVEADSSRYPIAASWLARAKRAYARMGRFQEWQAYLQKIKEQYRRRPALQRELRRL